MLEVNSRIIERDTSLEEKVSNGKVEDGCISEVVKLHSERISKLEQGQRDEYSITVETYKNREEQKINLRNKYAKGAYFLVWTWSIFLMVVLVLDAIEIIKFHLSDKIIIPLIVGVTINILAVYIVLMKNLFPSNRKHN